MNLPSRAVLALLALVCLALPAAAQDSAAGPDSLPQLGPHAAPVKKVDIQQLPILDSTPQFDAEAATAKYLARVSGPARARSDAYFEGGYGLEVVDLIYGLAIAAALLWLASPPACATGPPSAPIAAPARC